MSEAKTYRIQAETTTHTYVYCWNAARQALRRSREERQGSFYFNMMAGVFAAFMVEAFLNHLGQRRVKDWEVFERKLGPREKLLLLEQVLHFSTDLGKRPFQSLHEMLSLRDALAHGKTVTVASDLIVDNPEDESALNPEPKWKELCSLASVSRMVEDAELIVRGLSSKTGSKRDPFASLGRGSSKTGLVTGNKE
jgi:hypothetical protein